MRFKYEWKLKLPDELYTEFIDKEKQSPHISCRF